MSEKEYVTIDWLVKILIAIVAFFLIGIFFTVQKTASDVTDLKSNIKVLKFRSINLDKRVKSLENLKY